MKDALRSAGLLCSAPAAHPRRCGVVLCRRGRVSGRPQATRRRGLQGHLLGGVAGFTAALQEARVSPARPPSQRSFSPEGFSFETFTVGGEVRYSVTHYLPTPLEAMENPWVQWVVLAPGHLPRYAARDVGPRVVKALGLDTSITHMEWFPAPRWVHRGGRDRGAAAGARIMDLMGWVHDRDFFALWYFDGPRDPRALRAAHAAAAVFLRQPGRPGPRRRGPRGGPRSMGHLVVDRQLPGGDKAPMATRERAGRLATLTPPWCSTACAGSMRVRYA